jgi:putative transposase
LRPISKCELTEIRDATNKSWVLGTDRFKDDVAVLTVRQVKPKARGGDRKLKEYRESPSSIDPEVLSREMP